MCHASALLFGVENINREEVEKKRILDIGSHSHNGNYRSIATRFHPEEFIGIDIIDGPGVDRVLDAEKAVETFGEESFDMVIASEMLEHARNWRIVVSNIKRVCKKGGYIILTTRSEGFRVHGYPHDYWRYSVEDFKEIFSDLEILELKADHEAPGVFLKARKPENFEERLLEDIRLYSIIENRRIKEIDEEKEKKFQKRYQFYKKVIKTRSKIEGGVFRFIKKLFT